MKTKVIKLDSPMEFLAMLAGLASAGFQITENRTIKGDSEESSDELTVGFFIDRIAKRKGWKPERVNGWLAGIEEESPIAAFNIVLREIAVYLDSKYEDHIEHSEKIFVISTFDGVIHEIPKKYIKNFRNFAAFRTIEDAKIACNLLRTKLKGMFKSYGKQKN